MVFNRGDMKYQREKGKKIKKKKSNFLDKNHIFIYNNKYI